MSEKLTLEDFRRKAIEKSKSKLAFKDIAIEGYGVITFKRPPENQILAYMDKVAAAITTDENEHVVGQDMTQLLEAAKELIYPNCAFLQDKELHEALSIKDPLDIVTGVFGVQGAMSLASQIMDAFEGEKIQEQAEQEVKNL
jgi:hypothetical protein